MRAVWLENHVPPESIKVGVVESPHLEPGHLIVEVHAAGVNPSDVRYAAGVVPSTRLPRIPGRDFAGIVFEGDTQMIGTEVYGTGGDLGIKINGTHAQLVSLPISAVAPKPKSLSMIQAASIGVPYVTAYKALVELANVKAGDTVLLLGGSGAVGTAAAQIAKSTGARVIATRRSSDSDRVFLESADLVATVPDESIEQTVRDFTDGKGAQIVFNLVGGALFHDGVQSLAHGGRMVCITAPGERSVSFDLMDFYKRELHWHGLDTLELTASECAPILNRLRVGFESGAFKVAVGRTLPLEQASQAYQLVSHGGSGKVVLTMKG